MIQHTPDSPRLASLDLRELDVNETLFYFGVLAIQSLLLPRFQYSQDPSDRKWGCTLTMYGHTIVKPHLFDSQGVAKAEACREALKTLVSRPQKFQERWKRCIALSGEAASVATYFSILSGLRTPSRYSTSSSSSFGKGSSSDLDENWQLKATYVEIYNKQLRDLLVPIIHRTLLRLGSFPYQNDPEELLTQSVLCTAVILLSRFHGDIGGAYFFSDEARICFQSMAMREEPDDQNLINVLSGLRGRRRHPESSRSCNKSACDHHSESSPAVESVSILLRVGVGVVLSPEPKVAFSWLCAHLYLILG